MECPNQELQVRFRLVPLRVRLVVRQSALFTDSEVLTVLRNSDDGNRASIPKPDGVTNGARLTEESRCHGLVEDRGLR